MKNPPLLLLHGALGAAHQFDALAGKLSPYYEVHALDFTGHGSRAGSPDPFSLEQFKNDIRAYCDMYKMSGLYIFGYSMGGYVAAALAKEGGPCVRALMTLGTKWQWDPKTAKEETAKLNPDKIEEKVPQFAAALKKRHGEKNWRNVLSKTAEFMTDLGNGAGLEMDDLAKLNQPVCIGLGDQDNMVTLEETIATRSAISNSSLWVSPGAPHPLEQVSVSLLAENIIRWMTRH